MLCPNCNTENDDSANFCINCRAPLKSGVTVEPAASAGGAVTEPMATDTTPAAEPMMANTAINTPASEPASAAPGATASAMGEATTTTVNTGTPNFFAVIIAGLIKPMTTFKENLPKFSSVKNAGIFAVIVSVLAMALSLITTTYTLIRSEECEGYGKDKKCSLVLEWDRLEKVDWFDVTVKVALINLGVIVVVSGVFFGMSRAFKKNETNYFKMVAIVSSTVIPISLITFITSFVVRINTIVGMVLLLVGMLYALYIFHEGINEEVKLEGDKKIYFNIASVAVLIVVYYVALRVAYGNSADAVFTGGLSLGLGTSSSSDYSEILKYLDY